METGREGETTEKFSFLDTVVFLFLFNELYNYKKTNYKTNLLSNCGTDGRIVASVISKHMEIRLRPCLVLKKIVKNFKFSVTLNFTTHI